MQFKSLHSRIAVTFLSLILAIQFLGFGAIRTSINNNARASVNEQLQVGERIFRNILRQNGSNLAQAASILAADYGFRQAVTSNDEETIRSAVTNQQDRIGADIAIFYPTTNPASMPVGSIESPDAIKTVENLVTQINEFGKKNDFAILENQPYQVILVPVKAPITIGWILMGFKIDHELAKNLSRLTNLEVTFINRENSSSPWVSTASTHSLASLKELLALTPTTIAQGIESKQLMLQSGEYSTRYVEIFNEGGEPLHVVLQRSMDEATAPFETLQVNLLILTFLGALFFVAGSLITARKITNPISDLSEIAAQLEHGNFDVEISSSSQDEIGNLTRTFKRMVEAIKSRETNIMRLAYWDELTGLPNRASFIKSINSLIQSSASPHQAFSVMVMDLDRFKQINSILGHSAADSLLKLVGERIKSSIKVSHDVVARLGGDEFVVLLNNCNAEEAADVAKRLLFILEKPFNIQDQSVDLSASIGIASYPEHAVTVGDLLGRAEIAMYHAKGQHDGAVVFDQKYDVTSKSNLSLASELKAAVESNHFNLYVQPKVDLATGKVVSVEALIRWIHPEKGFIFPDQFIPYAEQTGHIRKISMWMLAESARFVEEWQKSDINVPIAVNLSARDLIDHDLADKISRILEAAKLGHHAITLEITESSIMDDPQRAQATLNKLSDMGIKLAIDDFGTGYSSLAYLKTLPISELKIDKSFVLKMDQDSNDSKIVRSTIDLGHNLGLKVVAEGIENKIVWDLLEEMGCDFGQGYFMSKPMPAKDFSKWLEQWNKSQINTVKANLQHTFVENTSGVIN